MKIKNKLALPVILTFLFFTNGLYAQEFAPLGAKWYFPRHHVWSAWTGVSIYESVGDTLINDKSCKILYNEDDVFPGSTGHSYFHQSSDTIYRYDALTNEFDMIIDFGAMPGDTFPIDNIYNNSYIDTTYCIVDSISYFNFSVSDSLRVQHVRQVAIYDFGNALDTFEASAEIIEKIGFAEALIPYELLIVGGNFRNGRIRCYEDNEVGLINFSDVDCLYTFIPTSTEELEKEVTLKIYPNPSSDYLNIYFRYPELKGKARFDLLDATGRSVLQFGSGHGDITHVVDVGSLSTGVYFLRCKIGEDAIVKQIVITR